MSLIIKNANLFGNNVVDIKINEEKIEAIGYNLEANGSEVYDAENRIVLPGGVDVHTHMSLDLGQYVAVDDFHTGTRAAAHGGTTTIVDHIAFGPKESYVADMIKHYHELADDKAIIDYSFHGAIQDARDETLRQIGELHKNEGIVSEKIYTTYGGKINDDDILKILKKAKETGTVVCIHCENDGAIQELRSEAEKEGKLDPIYHAKTRPPETEAEAINRLIYLSEIAGFPKLYIVHTSTELGLREIIKARKRGVKNLFCETCTQYLMLNDNKYVEGGNAEGIKYIMAPPLRKKSDQDFLWEGIRNGDVNVVATDHCPFFYEKEKLPHKDNFLTCPGGIPGVEERVELIISEGLRRGISLERLIEVLMINPAKIFGLYPKKGNIIPGADADIIILDKKEYTIKQENRHSIVDYTTYEGMKSDYEVSTVLCRGSFILKDGNYFGKQGYGKFIRRNFYE